MHTYKTGVKQFGYCYIAIAIAKKMPCNYILKQKDVINQRNNFYYSTFMVVVVPMAEDSI